MSRNSSRISTPSQPTTPEHLNDNFTKSQPNPFGISFVVPTSVVDVPSGGSYYDEQSSMFERKTLEIRQMTAKEEEILSNPDFIKDGTMLDRLIDSILVDKSINVKDMFASDKNAIVIEARKSAYGPEYKVSDLCGGCGTEQEFTFDLNKGSITENEKVEGSIYDPQSKTFSVKLPSSGIEVKIKVLSPQEEDYLVQQRQRAEKLSIASSETLNFLRVSVQEANGVTDQALLNQLFEVLPIIDIRTIKRVSNTAVPYLDTTQEVTCGSCGHATEREVPFSLGFFWPKL